MDFTTFISQVAEMASAALSEDVEAEESVLTLATAAGRSQAVRAYPFEDEGHSYVRLYTPLGKAGEIPHQRLVTAMELNSSLTHGAFSLFEGRLTLTDTLELEAIRLEEGARVLGYLGRMADTFEKLVYGVDRS